MIANPVYKLGKQNCLDRGMLNNMNQVSLKSVKNTGNEFLNSHIFLFSVNLAYKNRLRQKSECNVIDLFAGLVFRIVAYTDIWPIKFFSMSIISSVVDLIVRISYYLYFNNQVNRSFNTVIPIKCRII